MGPDAASTTVAALGHHRNCVKIMIDLAAANHTNRELDLMLAGKKPLAMFYGEISSLPHDEIVPESKFAPYVNVGRFVRGEQTYEGDFHIALRRNENIKYVFFAFR